MSVFNHRILRLTDIDRDPNYSWSTDYCSFVLSQPSLSIDWEVCPQLVKPRAQSMLFHSKTNTMPAKLPSDEDAPLELNDSRRQKRLALFPDVQLTENNSTP